MRSLMKLEQNALDRNESIHICTHKKDEVKKLFSSIIEMLSFSSFQFFLRIFFFQENR